MNATQSTRPEAPAFNVTRGAGRAIHMANFHWNRTTEKWVVIGTYCATDTNMSSSQNLSVRKAHGEVTCKTCLRLA